MYLINSSDPDRNRDNVYFENEAIDKRKEKRKERWSQFAVIFISAVLASVFTVIMEHFFSK